MPPFEIFEPVDLLIMNVLKKILHGVVLLYFTLETLFFIFSSIITFYYLSTQHVDITLYTPISTLTYALLFLSSLYKTWKDRTYKLAIVTLFIILLTTTVHRFFFITNQSFTRVDLENFLLFGLPLIILIFLKLGSRMH